MTDLHFTARTGKTHLPYLRRMLPLAVGEVARAPREISIALVGDTVNVAQRLEQFAKEIDDGRSDVIIVASEAVAGRLPVEIAQHPLGRHAVLARADPMPVYRLDVSAELRTDATVTPLQGSAVRL